MNKEKVPLAGPLSFTLALSMLCATYFVAEHFINAYMIISVDEFWFAHLLERYQHHLPYRDFSPYKTVLGYYLLLLPAAFTGKDLISSLILIKNAIAAWNALLLFAASFWLTRFFSKPAVLMSLILLLASDLMLTYSTHIRVDLLAYWFGLFSCLCLMETLSRHALKYDVLGGVLMGLGFATSQKVVWYILASHIAFGLVWLGSADKRSLFKKIFIFDIALFSVVIIYLSLWALSSSWQTVWHNVFDEAATLYHLDWYALSRGLFWSYTLSFNTLLFLLCPVTLLALRNMDLQDATHQHRLFAITYALTVVVCLIPYKQVFPYYMQVMIPMFLILYAAFFSWLLATLNATEQKIFPLFILLILCGILYPLVLFSQKLVALDGAYQKANLGLLETLLQDGSDYVAGIDLIYRKDQPIAGMKHLMGPAIDYLHHPTEKLKSVMLASLDQDPNASQASVIHALAHSRVKYYVNNYRMQALPPQIKTYLNNQFTHLWGSIYTYAPLIPTGSHIIPIRFSGTYRIVSSDATQNGKKVKLTQGNHRFTARTAYRLKLIVAIPKEISLDQRFQEDHWQAVVL